MEAPSQKRDINELLTTGYFKTTRGKSPSGWSRPAGGRSRRPGGPRSGSVRAPAEAGSAARSSLRVKKNGVGSDGDRRNDAWVALRGNGVAVK